MNQSCLHPVVFCVTNLSERWCSKKVCPFSLPQMYHVCASRRFVSFQSTNQSIAQSINQSSKPINRSIKQSVDQPINQCINQSVSQSIHQSIIVCSLATQHSVWSPENRRRGDELERASRTKPLAVSLRELLSELGRCATLVPFFFHHTRSMISAKLWAGTRCQLFSTEGSAWGAPPSTKMEGTEI